MSAYITDADVKRGLTRWRKGRGTHSGYQFVKEILEASWLGAGLIGDQPVCADKKAHLPHTGCDGIDPLAKNCGQENVHLPHYTSDNSRFVSRCAGIESVYCGANKKHVEHIMHFDDKTRSRCLGEPTTPIVKEAAADAADEYRKDDRAECEGDRNVTSESIPAGFRAAIAREQLRRLDVRSLQIVDGCGLPTGLSIVRDSEHDEECYRYLPTQLCRHQRRVLV